MREIEDPYDLQGENITRTFLSSASSSSCEIFALEHLKEEHASVIRDPYVFSIVAHDKSPKESNH
jgi:hypothetical protein